MRAVDLARLRRGSGARGAGEATAPAVPRVGEHIDAEVGAHPLRRRAGELADAARAHPARRARRAAGAAVRERARRVDLAAVVRAAVAVGEARVARRDDAATGVAARAPLAATQTDPQAPQWARELAVSTSQPSSARPLQSAKGAAQPATQRPCWHTARPLVPAVAACGRRRRSAGRRCCAGRPRSRPGGRRCSRRSRVARRDRAAPLVAAGGAVGDDAGAAARAAVLDAGRELALAAVGGGAVAVGPSPGSQSRAQTAEALSQRGAAGGARDTPRDTLRSPTPCAGASRSRWTRRRRSLRRAPRTRRRRSGPDSQRPGRAGRRAEQRRTRRSGRRSPRGRRRHRRSRSRSPRTRGRRRRRARRGRPRRGCPRGSRRLRDRRRRCAGRGRRDASRRRRRPRGSGARSRRRGGSRPGR